MVFTDGKKRKTLTKKITLIENGMNALRFLK